MRDAVLNYLDRWEQSVKARIEQTTGKSYSNSNQKMMSHHTVVGLRMTSRIQITYPRLFLSHSYDIVNLYS